MSSRWQPMAREEEAHLAALVRLGDREALARLVAGNLRFVRKVARRYRHCGLPMEDLVAEGCVGIVQAARRFDPSRGNRFVTYAVWWIRKSILAALGEKTRIVRLPEGQVRRILQVLGAESAEPREGLSWAREMSLSEAPAGKERTPLDWLQTADPSAEQEIIREDRARKLRAALGRLTRQEQEVLAMRFGLDDRPVLTLRELGRRMSLSNERVRQIELHARKRLAFLLRGEEGWRKQISGALAPPARPGRGTGRSRRAASAPGIA